MMALLMMLRELDMYWRCCYECYRNRQHCSLPRSALLHSNTPSQILAPCAWLDTQWLWLTVPRIHCALMVLLATLSSLWQVPAVNHFIATLQPHSTPLFFARSVAILAFSLTCLFSSRPRCTTWFVVAWIFMSKWWHVIIVTRGWWNEFPPTSVSIKSQQRMLLLLLRINC